MPQNVDVNSERGKVICSKCGRTYGTRREENPNRIDIIEATIGDFGRWQCKISVLMALLRFPTAWIQLGIVFLAPPTEFWCNPPREYRFMDVYEWKHLINIPNNTFKSRSTLEYGNCKMWYPVNGSVIPCAWGYAYNKSVIHSSIITEWNLVCDKSYLIELSQIVLMFGVLIGSIWIGLTADKLGRAKVLKFAIVFQSIFGILTGILPWFSTFLIARFLLAVANGGVTVISFVLCMEVVGGAWRTIVPILYHIPFGIGNLLMAFFAYFLRDWRTLQLTLFGSSFLYITYIWIISESPRWLWVVGKKEQSIELLEKAARVNELDLAKVRLVVDSVSSSSALNNQRKKLGLKMLFKTPELRRRTIALSLSSVIAGMNFLGFSEYLGQVSANIYLAVSIGGIAVVPGTFACIYFINRYGRTLSISFASCFIGLCFYGICLFPVDMYKNDWPRIILSGSGFFGMSIAYPALCLFTGELFPTILRNAGMGVTVMFSKLGSMIAPIVLESGEYATFIPLLILGSVSFLQAALILPLPDTLNRQLPDTIEDVEEMSHY
ncbi:hypothetical protein RI129_001988 [Pyrocoelia pectoralis]|uniref:Major facilitator superfamily (MFS) profile domain-containing protein n=1 Tax=Pyrocoelia pectoralis TaxID=417401 RepID=A0AAN7W102_9COLE